MHEGPAVGLLALLAIAVLTPLTLGGYVASSVDTDAFYGPMVQFLNERLHAGDFPLWLPTAFSGQPFFADPQSGLFYPPTLVANALLDPGDALAAVVAFHYLLGTLGAYAFVRLLRAGRLGAVYAALAFGVGGAMIARSQALGLLGGASWLPVSLACAQLVALRGGRFGAPAVGLALCFTGLVLTGSQQLTAVIVIVCLMWLAMRSGWRGVLVGAAAGAVAAALAGIAVVPRMEFLSLSTVPEGVDDPDGLGRFVFGDRRVLLGPFGVTVHTEVMTLYAGALTPALAVWALWQRRPYAKELSVLGAFALVWATGLAGWLLAPVPILSSLSSHQPVRVLPVLALVLAALAGLALTAPGLPRVGIAVALALWIGLLASPGDLIAPEYLVALAASVAALACLRSPRVGAVAGAIILLSVLSVDLARHAYTQENPNQRAANWEPAEAIFAPPGPSASYLLAQQSAEGPFRFASLGLEMLLHQLSNTRREPHRSLLMNMAATRLGLEDVAGYNPLHLKTTSAYMERSNGEPVERHWEWALRPATEEMRKLGVRYYVAREQEVPAGLPVVWSDGKIAIARDDQALPFARLERPGAAPVKAAILHREPDRIVLRSPAGPAGRLVLAETQYPGWVVRVDGQRAVPRTQDGLFRAVDLPAGGHTVEWSFEPPSLRRGALVSLIGLVGLLALGFGPRLRRAMRRG